MGQYVVDGKHVLIIGPNYNGSPLIVYKYDILIIPTIIFKKFKKELLPEHQINSGWKPKIIKI